MGSKNGHHDSLDSIIQAAERVQSPDFAPTLWAVAFAGDLLCCRACIPSRKDRCVAPARSEAVYKLIVVVWCFRASVLNYGDGRGAVAQHFKQYGAYVFTALLRANNDQITSGAL